MWYSKIFKRNRFGYYGLAQVRVALKTIALFLPLKCVRAAKSHATKANLLHFFVFFLSLFLSIRDRKSVRAFCVNNYHSLLSRETKTYKKKHTHYRQASTNNINLCLILDSQAHLIVRVILIKIYFLSWCVVDDRGHFEYLILAAIHL